MLAYRLGVQSVTVTPRYTEERTEDSVRLTGIYHIAANVEFGEGLGRGMGRFIYPH